jgi:amino acid transporter
MGLNVVQWGLVLTGVLLSAYIMSKEMYTSRRRKEVLKRAPSEYHLLLFFLILTIVSFQATAIFSSFEIKILLIGYIISTIFMVSYFLRRVEKYYLRYGTVSIILLTCILFLHANILKSDPNENMETPQILIDHSIIIEKDDVLSKSNLTGPESLVIDDLRASNYLISGPILANTSGDMVIERILETSP